MERQEYEWLRRTIISINSQKRLPVKMKETKQEACMNYSCNPKQAKQNNFKPSYNTKSQDSQNAMKWSVKRPSPYYINFT